MINEWRFWRTLKKNLWNNVKPYLGIFRDCWHIPTVLHPIKIPADRFAPYKDPSWPFFTLQRPQLTVLHPRKITADRFASYKDTSWPFSTQERSQLTVCTLKRHQLTVLHPRKITTDRFAPYKDPSWPSCTLERPQLHNGCEAGQIPEPSW